MRFGHLVSYNDNFNGISVVNINVVNINAFINISPYKMTIKQIV